MISLEDSDRTKDTKLLSIRKHGFADLNRKLQILTGTHNRSEINLHSRKECDEQHKERGVGGQGIPSQIKTHLYLGVASPCNFMQNSNR